MTHNDFDTFVTHLIATLPDLDVTITDVTFVDGQMVVTRGDQSQVIDVAPFEQAYRRRPDALDAVVATLLRVSKGERGVPDPGYQAIASQIIPQLKPVVLLMDLLERGADPIVYRLFLGDIMVTYAIRDNGRLSFLTEAQLERWGVSEYTVHEHAVANLRAMSENVPYHVAGEGDSQIVIFNNEDGLDAVRLLLPDIIADAARGMPGNLVIGIPNRDFMVVINDEDADRITAVSLQIQRDMRQHAHGLTRQLFTIANGEVREFTGV
ncbi:MAG: DUF1444 family protein [Roseiflexaceae bacterium]